MLTHLVMQENHISEIAEGDFEGLSKLNSEYDCVVSTRTYITNVFFFVVIHPDVL